MAQFPKKPSKGDRVLQSIYNTVCDIVDYIPSLEVVGDNKTTYVNHTAGGTTIHAIQQGTTLIQGGKGKEYTSGRFIQITSANAINCLLSGDEQTVFIRNNVISAVGAGGTVYIEDNFGVPNLSSLNFNNAPPEISGNGISWLIPVSAGQQITYATGASGNVNASYAPAKGKSGSSFAITRDILSTIPQDGYVRITAFDDGKHFNQCLRVLDGTTDWNQGLPLYKFGNFQHLEGDNKYIFVQSGVISTNLHGDQTTIKILEDGTISCLVNGGEPPSPPCTYFAGSGLALSSDNQTFYLTATIPTSTSQLYNDVPFLTSSNVYGDGDKIGVSSYLNGIQIYSKLTGLNQLDNSTTNYITQDDIPASTTYIGTSGIGLSTILDSNNQPTTSSAIYISADFYNILTNPTNNTILSCSNGALTWATNTGGSGGGGGCPWPDYGNLGEESNSIVYPLMRYTTSTGGWLRISDKNSYRCNGVWIGDNYVGLGFGADTWTLAIPPGSSFYIDTDFNPTRTKAWFDSTVSPGKITIEEFLYWGTPPQWDPNYLTIIDLKNNFNEARSYETSCYDCMTGALIQLNLMKDDWAKYEHEYTSQPKSVEWYQERLDEMNKKLSGDDDNLGCDYYLSEATDYAAEVATLNNSLPSANPMFAYQSTDIPARCQQYYGKIEQYITSGQYYYNLADDYWQAHSQE